MLLEFVPARSAACSQRYPRLSYALRDWSIFFVTNSLKKTVTVTKGNCCLKLS